MAIERERALSNEALDRLAREWFAEARAPRREDERKSGRSDPGGDARDDLAGTLLDWLSGSGDDDSGDCGD